MTASIKPLQDQLFAKQQVAYAVDQQAGRCGYAGFCAGWCDADCGATHIGAPSAAAIVGPAAWHVAVHPAFRATLDASWQIERVHRLRTMTIIRRFIDHNQPVIEIGQSAQARCCPATQRATVADAFGQRALAANKNRFHGSGVAHAIAHRTDEAPEQGERRHDERSEQHRRHMRWRFGGIAQAPQA